MHQPPTLLVATESNTCCSKPVDHVIRSMTEPESVTGNDPFARSSLYTPLVHLTKEDTGKKRKLPQNVKETALFETLGVMSTNYIQSLTENQEAPGRALKPDQFREKLQGRAITLIGGYHRSKQKRVKERRKRRRSVKVQPNDNSWLNDSKAIKRQCKFLRELNRHWNEYMTTMISDVRDESTLGSYLNTTSIEWMGALVRVAASRAHPKWVGVVGVLVKSTLNTWVIASFDDGLGWSKSDRKDEKATPSFRYYVVPKRDSVVEAMVPVNGTAEEVFYCIELRGSTR